MGATTQPAIGSDGRPIDLRGVGNLLAGSEEAQFSLRQHPVVLVKPLLVAMGVLVLAALITLTSPYSQRGLPRLAWLATGASLLWVAFQIAEWRVEHVVVTNKRVMKVSGLLFVKRAMMPLTKVTDMGYRQSPWGRMLRYGDFHLESAGQDQDLTKLERVPHSDLYYKLISDLIFGGEVDDEDQPPSNLPAHREVTDHELHPTGELPLYDPAAFPVQVSQDTTYTWQPVRQRRGSSSNPGA